MIRSIPFSVLIPNLITLSGLIIGISSIKYALLGKWEIAVLCILLAAIIDGIDGRIARILNSSSKFGSELDSLCDLANFGVSPAILIYLWAFNHYEFHLIAWGSSMFFTACIAIRLAKFNLLNEDIKSKKSLTTEQNEEEEYIVKNKLNYFYGIPAPSAAILILIPMMLEFNLTNIVDYKISGYKIFLNIYILFIAFLTAGNFRTISLKNFKINKEYFSFLMSLFIILFIIVILYPWYIIPVLGVLYLINIPIYILYLKYRKNKHKTSV
ncbi:MAG: phosphatidylcholine/phosphatidylserine synthase [Rickettsia sp.]|nr:phosphatidylcholine/phosphatidylserine synthase [Rickettsia sp.]